LLLKPGTELDWDKTEQRWNNTALEVCCSGSMYTVIMANVGNMVAFSRDGGSNLALVRQNIVEVL